MQNRDERIQLIKTARAALDAVHKQDMPVVAGVGTLSTRETIDLARDAATAGADYALVIPPGYYGGVLQVNPVAIQRFYVDVAAASPIPVYVPVFSGFLGFYVLSIVYVDIWYLG